MFHRFDVENSEETLRYTLGTIFYMVDFYVQCIILLATFVYAFVIYIRLALFLKPRTRVFNE